MKNEKIVDQINILVQDYKNYKDDGTELIKKLASYVENLPVNEKTSVLDFFLLEIQFNDYNIWDLCLETIVEMKLVDLAQYLEKIFINKQYTKDEIWRRKLISSMLKLQYKSKIYYKYLKDSIIENPSSGYFLLIYYSSIEPTEAINLLSEFYVANLDGNIKMQAFVKSRLNFLFSYVLRNPSDYLSRLVAEVLKRNIPVGLFLKNIFIEHLQNSIENKVNDGIIETLNNTFPTS